MPGTCYVRGEDGWSRARSQPSETGTAYGLPPSPHAPPSQLPHPFLFCSLCLPKGYYRRRAFTQNSRQVHAASASKAGRRENSDSRFITFRLPLQTDLRSTDAAVGLFSPVSHLTVFPLPLPIVTPSSFLSHSLTLPYHRHKLFLDTAVLFPTPHSPNGPSWREAVNSG